MLQQRRLRPSELLSQKLQQRELLLLRKSQLRGPVMKRSSQPSPRASTPSPDYLVRNWIPRSRPWRWQRSRPRWQSVWGCINIVILATLACMQCHYLFIAPPTDPSDKSRIPDRGLQGGQGRQSQGVARRRGRKGGKGRGELTRMEMTAVTSIRHIIEGLCMYYSTSRCVQTWVVLNHDGVEFVHVCMTIDN